MSTAEFLVNAKAGPESRQTANRMRNYWRAADAAVLLVYSTVVIYAVGYHEKWADEAQAWLLARDLSLKTLWFHELRYEGTPGLWHTLLWVAQRVFHAGYDSFGYIGAACAILGAAWLVFRAPFPRAIRWLAAFSYFYVYQYAVVARPYVLFALFSLIIAERFRDGKRPALFALSLAPLAMLTAHGSLMAFTLGIVYAVKFVRRWREHNGRERKQFVWALCSVTVMYVFLLVVLFPAKDTEATHNIPLTHQVITSRIETGLGGALVDNRWLSAVVLALFAVWCYRRKALASLLLPLVPVVGLYAYIGWEHQQGTIFLVILTALAIAWPSEEERTAFAAGEKRDYQVVITVLGFVLCYQVYMAGRIIRNDIHLPYCGAQNAAQYLRPLVQQHKVIYGYQYGMVAVNGYFDQNIFANWPHAYYHHSAHEFDATNVGPEIARGRPDYVVSNWWDELDSESFRAGQLLPMKNLGYSLVHGSNGYLLTKGGYTFRQFYFVFKRNQ